MSRGDERDLGADSEVIDLRGLDRRAALKRGAVVASAALWATPVVQTVGISRAAAQDPSVPSTTTTTSEPPTTTTSSTTTSTSTTSTSTTSTSTTSTTIPTTTTTAPPVGTICNIQIVVRHNQCLYGLLYDGHRWVQWSAKAPNAVDCIRFFGQANQVDTSWLLAALFSIRVPVTKVSNALWRIRLPLPTGVEYVAGWGQVGDASATNCRPPVVTATTIDFSAS
jgi:hypothetical protein